MQTALKKLTKLLLHIGETELQIEFARLKLCKAQTFEPYAAFQRLDRDGKGQIWSRDLYRYLKE